MTDVVTRVADPDDLRFLIMFAAVLLAGALLCVGALARVLRDERRSRESADGFGQVRS
ncbi:hypothetical protein PMI42_00740 [Bradyrhizobium sp. YR681]|uniref:hypothetical protein n=1 Tax=Bradyrhizobium sp. YR681 TaxID=1144344 RepID=UPI000270E6A0|nr:hypothetical protein [Bradyrhizobium sp. YR681]EJN15722.1 hypothetical protein PMI42_00740 [Bradyrhizobium sp. YR681]